MWRNLASNMLTLLIVGLVMLAGIILWGQRQYVATRYRVVVAEGVTSWQVVNAISNSDLFAGEVAETPDEGSLAPDGYEIRV